MQMTGGQEKKTAVILNLRAVFGSFGALFKCKSVSNGERKLMTGHSPSSSCDAMRSFPLFQIFFHFPPGGGVCTPEQNKCFCSSLRFFLIEVVLFSALLYRLIFSQCFFFSSCVSFFGVTTSSVENGKMNLAHVGYSSLLFYICRCYSAGRAPR